MIDLMTSRGRSLALRSMESRVRRLESDIEDRAEPILRRISDIDHRVLAAIGGGVVVASVIALASQFFGRSAPPRPASKSKRPAATRAASAAGRGSAKAASNGRAHA